MRVVHYPFFLLWLLAFQPQRGFNKIEAIKTSLGTYFYLVGFGVDDAPPAWPDLASSTSPAILQRDIVSSASRLPSCASYLLDLTFDDRPKTSARCLRMVSLQVARLCDERNRSAETVSALHDLSNHGNVAHSSIFGDIGQVSEYQLKDSVQPAHFAPSFSTPEFFNYTTVQLPSTDSQAHRVYIECSDITCCLT